MKISSLILVLVTATLFCVVRTKRRTPRSAPVRRQVTERIGTVLTTMGPAPFWPPTAGKPFPDLAVTTEDGENTSLFKVLEKFNAKLILVEPAALTCAGCHAFAGAHTKGNFRGVSPQTDLKSIEQYFEQFGHSELVNNDVVFVQILLYSMTMGPVSAKDAREWANHFEMGLKERHLVIGAGNEYQNAASMAMVPGFYLLDSQLQVVKESVGYSPKSSLYTDLIPLAASMLR